MYTAYTSPLLKELESKENAKSKAWWENYVKESAPFLGVKMGDVRKIVHKWYADQVAGNLTDDEEVGLALALMKGKYTEQKLAGILFLQEVLLPAKKIDYERALPHFAKLFQEGYLYDWNITDWFCIKVLGPMIAQEGKGCATQVIAWHKAENLWQARAALVAFVPLAENRSYYPMIEAAGKVVIRRDERFAKTALGWILHDISKVDKGFVEDFVTQNISFFSLESLKNAIKYFPKEEQKEYKVLLKRQN